QQSSSPFAKPAECEQNRGMEAESLSRAFAELSTPLIADAALRLKIPTRINLPFQRSIHFFRVLQRAASFRVLLGPTIDADKEIALALQRGESRIRRGGGQRPKISREIRSKKLNSPSSDTRSLQ